MKNLTGNKPVIFLNPYLAIAVAAIVAYLPVSSMLLALKNDIIAIEYPIQHFLSESLRNGESPVWFNTWAMGFPLQSILSWSFFSTPQTIISLLFGSSIYILHIEFVLYIMASGWCMYHLLKKHFIEDRDLALILSCCYMLSGFTVASSQWLLYITCMTFIPLLMNSLLNLLKAPSLKNAILFAIFYYLLLTNVHIYITIVFSYVIFFYLLYYFTNKLIAEKDKKENIILLKFSLLAFLFTVLLAAIPVYYTIELIGFLHRNNPIENNPSFFHSNYLHPKALSSLLLPLSSVRAGFSNTEGTLLNVYIGLLPLILFTVSLVIIKKQKNTRALVLLFISLFFLALSFGHITPLREWVNILPGMSFFRNAGVLRVFFNLFFILYLSSAFKEYKFSDIINRNMPSGRSIMAITGLICGILLLVLILNANTLPGLYKNSFYQTLKQAGPGEFLLFNSFTQLLITLLLFLAFLKKKKFVLVLLISELIINTLLCTPYYTTGTYTVKEVNNILLSPPGFRVQQQLPGEVASTFLDKRGNAWHNINTFKKQISNQVSMTGPLFLSDVYKFLVQPALQQTLFSKQILFIADTPISSTDSIVIIQQKPNKVTAQISLTTGKEIILQQSYFPGWKAYYNDEEIPLSESGGPFVSANVPEGRGTITFIFEKKMMILSAILLHLIVLFCLAFFLRRKII